MRFVFPIKRFRLCAIGLIIIFVVYTVNIALYVKVQFTEIKEQITHVNLSYVVVHLDLKGAPPNLEYLNSLLGKLKRLGANALLIEYEDMFPYEGTLANISTPFHYDRNGLKKFLKLAYANGFEVVPLVQTFGHMEFVLKLEEFHELRETSVFLDSICPSKMESLILIKEMIKQVMFFHQNIGPLNYIHIGFDEVYHMNKCEDCQARELDKHELYFQHLRAVTAIVKGFNPDATVLIWADMLATVEPAYWLKVKRFEGIELVYWDYRPMKPNAYRDLHGLNKYADNIWIATAFKGADGPQSIFPDLINRIQNHYLWLSFMSNFKFAGETEVYKFKGIILTGWSRYNHFSPICDLLPVSIPSLVANLLIVKRFTNGIKSKYIHNKDWVYFYDDNIEDDVSIHLECNWKAKKNILDFKSCSYNLTFPLYNNLMMLEDHIDHSIAVLEHHFVNKFKYYPDMKEVTSRFKWCKRNVEDLKKLEIITKRNLRLYFDNQVYKEYLGYLTYEAQVALKNCIDLLAGMQNVTVFGRGRNISFSLGKFV